MSRPNEKLYYFKWVPKEADADERLRAMDDREYGFFMRCLNHAWQNGGSLPADLSELARVLHRRMMYIGQVWPRVGKCFVPLEGDESRIVNPRQWREYQDALVKSGKATDAVRNRYERKSNEVRHAFAGAVSVSDSVSGVEVSSEEGAGETEPFDPPETLPAAIDRYHPTAILAELKPIYLSAGVPIAERQETLILQYIAEISPPEKRLRVPNYVKWALVTGRWPNPSKTKSLLSLMQCGDWDVEIAERVLPNAMSTATKRESATAAAARRFMEDLPHGTH